MNKSGRRKGIPAHTASRGVATVVMRRLLDGCFPPGSRLPTEREMALSFSVSRHVVREALKRLEALGLVEIQHGSGAYACDVALTGGMELFEYLLFDESDHFDQRALSDLLVFCNLFVPNVLRLAATNRTDEHLAEIRQALAQRPGVLNDLTGFMEVHLRMMRAIALAADNRIYQLLFNNIGRLFARLRALVPLEQFAPVADQSELEHLFKAMESRDSELAGLLAQRLIERAQHRVSVFLQGAPEASQ